jgi:Amidohydrolase family
LLEGIAALSREHSLPVLTHVYETRVQAAAAQLDTSGSLIDKLARAGLMNDRLGVVHGVWLSPRHIAQIADAGARVVHNPISNLKLKSGVAPILDLYRAGVDVALGCDNCSCAESQNIFTAMRMLCLLPAVTEPDPGPINAGYALKAATLSGARAVGLGDKLGALKPGMAADIVILDLNEPAFVPFNSAARQIVYAESGRAVETVFVNGRPVVRGASSSPWMRQNWPPKRSSSRRSSVVTPAISPPGSPTSRHRCSTPIARRGGCRSDSNATSVGRRVTGSDRPLKCALHRPAATWHHDCRVNGPKPRGTEYAGTLPQTMYRDRRHDARDVVSDCAKLADPAGHDGRPIRRRQRVRYGRANPCRAPFGGAGPAGRGRKRGWRRGHDRDGARGKCPA